MSADSSKPAIIPKTVPETQIKPYWSPVAAFAVVLITIVLVPILLKAAMLFVPQLFGLSSNQVTHWLSNSTFANFLYVLLAETSTASVLFVFITKRKAPFWSSIGVRRPRLSDTGYALVGVVAYFVLFAVTLGIVQSFTNVDTGKEQALGFHRGIGGFNLVLAFISLVILPPIAEELTFRGFLYGTLRRHRLPVVWSVLLTSVLFGFFHLFGSADGSLLWLAFIDTLVLSLVLCMLREKTGSIWASILLHALKNGFVFVNLFIIAGR